MQIILLRESPNTSRLHRCGTTALRAWLPIADLIWRKPGVLRSGFVGIRGRGHITTAYKIVGYPRQTPTWASTPLNLGPAKTRACSVPALYGRPPMGLASVGNDDVKHASHCVSFDNQVTDFFCALAFFCGSHGSRGRSRCAAWENINSAQCR